jgi:hypothetical protein
MQQPVLGETGAQRLPRPAVPGSRFQPSPDRQARGQKQDYLAYMLPTTLVVPMIAYGTRLEPVLALALTVAWGIYAAICFVRGRKKAGGRDDLGGEQSSAGELIDEAR